MNDSENNSEFIIIMKGVKKAFDGNEVLKNINLSVKKARTLWYLAKSGQGKSVTIKCIIGMIQPDEGSVNVMGLEVET